MRVFFITLFMSFIIAGSSLGAPPKKNKNVKSKFYDFGEQVIDGELRKPTGTYASSRSAARFERLLGMKKSFLPNLYRTSKSKIFK